MVTALFDTHQIAAPSRVIAAHTPAQLPSALAALEQALQNGEHAIGFFAYELGYLMDPATQALLPENISMPLLWFAVGQLEDAAFTKGTYTTGPITPALNRAAYIPKCSRIIDDIHAGEVYQTNLTFKARFAFHGDPAAFYADLRNRQPSPYTGFVSTPQFSILSLSPELFLECSNGKITTRPMKGTAPRGLHPQDDAQQKQTLRNDPKQRAENLMIVDLMRNDLGRIAQTGTVKADKLFAIETHPTLHQMTSDVTAQLPPAATLRSILEALFPPGSITGAPKIKAMQIIRTLETEPRGVYCGAFGHLGPDGYARFNVAIRTVTIQNGQAEIGIGSGIVADSNPSDEYDECLLKMRFLHKPAYSLIETMRYDQGVYYLRDHHLTRLQHSARALGFKYTPPALPDYDAPKMVRLVLSPDGEYTITAKSFEIPTEMRFVISDKRITSTDPLLYHKTTQRDLYDAEHARLTASGTCDEVLFLNERGELAEGSRTTLFLQRDGILLTPALHCGLLPGTLRAHLLQSGKARETVLTPADLTAAEALFLGNSVRGLIPARIVVL